MSALEFQIDLSGNFASVLSKGTKELGEHEKAIKGAKGELELFEAGIGEVSGSLGGLGFNLSALGKGGSLFTFDLAEALHGALEVVSSLVEKFADLGTEMVKVAGETQGLDLAIKLDVGEEGEKKVDALAQSFRNSAFSPEEMKKAMLPILEQSGMKHADEWDELTTAASDVATRRHTGFAGVQAALNAFNDIDLNPQRLRGSLKELGLVPQAFYENLGSLNGISATAAEAQIKSGKIKSDQLINVALDEIQKREGGALGNATNQGSKTLDATLARLGNLKKDLFAGIADSQGMHDIQGFLDNIESTISGPLGHDLIDKVSTAFTTMFGDLSGPDGAKKLETVIGSIESKASSLVDELKDAWPSIKEGFASLIPIAKTLGDTLGVVAKTIDVLTAHSAGKEINALHEWDPNANPFDALRAKVAYENSAHIPEGTGPLSNESMVKIGDGGVGKMSASYDPINDAGAGSPLMVPAMADGGVVTRPTLALVGEAGPEAVIPLEQYQSGVGGGPRVVNYNVEINCTGEADAREGLARAEQEFRANFARLIQEVST